MYTIAFDQAARTLHLTLEGFWTEATLAGFAAELTARMGTVRSRHGAFAVLSDATRFAVQSPEIAHGFERIMAQGANLRSGPTAIVVASVLNKLQVERSMASPRLAAFLTLKEAQAWLAGQGY